MVSASPLFGLEADALAPDLAAARRLARLAHLAHGVQVLRLEALLVVERHQRVLVALEVELAQTKRLLNEERARARAERAVAETDQKAAEDRPRLDEDSEKTRFERRVKEEVLLDTLTY